MTASREVNGGTGSGQPHARPDPGLEPLLWLQLLGIGAVAGEALALLVLLGSVDPGPLPGLERLLIWALGALAPAVLLSKRPADPWSLLVLQAPLRGRREIQRRLMRLQDQPGLRLLPLLVAVLLLPALWRIDQSGGLATGLSPLADSNRLVVLLLSLPLLAVIVWQGQQIGQALWLLSRPADAIRAADPLSVADLEQGRLSLGLPLLLLDPLQPAMAVPRPAAKPETLPDANPPAASPAVEIAETTARPSSNVAAADVETSADTGAETETRLSEPSGPAAAAMEPSDQTLEATTSQAASEPTAAPAPKPESDQATLAAGADSILGEELHPAGSPITPPLAPEPAPIEPSPSDQTSATGSIKPEQASEDGEGGDLNQQITGLQP